MRFRSSHPEAHAHILTIRVVLRLQERQCTAESHLHFVSCRREEGTLWRMNLIYDFVRDWEPPNRSVSIKWCAVGMFKYFLPSAVHNSLGVLEALGFNVMLIDTHLYTSCFRRPSWMERLRSQAMHELMVVD